MKGIELGICRGGMINYLFMLEESVCFCVVGMLCGLGLKYKVNNFFLYIVFVYEGFK